MCPTSPKHFLKMSLMCQALTSSKSQALNYIFKLVGKSLSMSNYLSIDNLPYQKKRLNITYNQKEIHGWTWGGHHPIPYMYGKFGLSFSVFKICCLTLKTHEIFIRIGIY